MAEKKEKVKGKGGGSKIIIIVLLVLLVFSAGFAGYLFLTKDKSSDENSSKLPTAIEPGAATTQTQANAEYVAPFKIAMDEFLVNLADEGGKRYFKLKLSIGYDTKKEKEMTAEFEEKKDNLRDAIISVLRSKKTTDLATQKNIDDLKKDILMKINPIFENGKAYNIYITDILIQ